MQFQSGNPQSNSVGERQSFLVGLGKDIIYLYLQTQILRKHYLLSIPLALKNIYEIRK